MNKFALFIGFLIILCVVGAIICAIVTYESVIKKDYSKAFLFGALTILDIVSLVANIINFRILTE